MFGVQLVVYLGFVCDFFWFYLGFTWFLFGRILGSFWVRFGVFIWFLFGICLACIWFLWSFDAASLGFFAFYVWFYVGSMMIR